MRSTPRAERFNLLPSKAELAAAEQEAAEQIIEKRLQKADEEINQEIKRLQDPFSTPTGVRTIPHLTPQ